MLRFDGEIQWNKETKTYDDHREGVIPSVEHKYTNPSAFLEGVSEVYILNSHQEGFYISVELGTFSKLKTLKKMESAGVPYTEEIAGSKIKIKWFAISTPPAWLNKFINILDNDGQFDDLTREDIYRVLNLPSLRIKIDKAQNHTSSIAAESKLAIEEQKQENFRVIEMTIEKLQKTVMTTAEFNQLIKLCEAVTETNPFFQKAAQIRARWLPLVDTAGEHKPDETLRIALTVNNQVLATSLLNEICGLPNSFTSVGCNVETILALTNQLKLLSEENQALKKQLPRSSSPRSASRLFDSSAPITTSSVVLR